MLYFIHGLNGNPKNWYPSLDFFRKQGFSCEAIDLRNKANLKKTNIGDYIRKVAHLVDNDDVLIGHSMGGLIVQKVAESKKIKAGICLCSAPPKGIRFKFISIPHLKYIPFILFNRPFKVSYQLAKELLFNCVSEKEAIIAYKQLKKESAKVIFQVMMNKVVVDQQRMKAPLFFIAAEQDKASPPALVEKIADKYDAQVRVVPGCHYIFANIDPINQEIANILQQIQYAPDL